MPTFTWYCCACNDGPKIPVENPERGLMNEKSERYTTVSFDFGKTFTGLSLGASSVLIADNTTRDYFAPYTWFSSMVQNSYASPHTEGLCRTIACVSAYTCGTTLLYRNGRCKYRDAWLISGILGGMILGLGLGREFEEVLLHVLPWTVLMSLICCAACSDCILDNRQGGS